MNSLAGIAQDLRYALRTLRRAPTFAVVVIALLAIGIGSATAAFSLADALLLRPLAVDHPERLVTLEQRLPDGRSLQNFGYADYERFRDLTHVFAGVTATTWIDGFGVAAAGQGADERPERVSVVTGNFFSMLGVPPERGRVFSQDDDVGVGGHLVAVISDRTWTRVFGRDSGVVGRTVTVNGVALQVVGVAPRAFEGDWVGWPTDIWIPVAALPDVNAGTTRAVRGGHRQFKLLARLAPGATPAMAEAAVTAIRDDIVREKVQGAGAAAGSKVVAPSAARGYSTQRTTLGTPVSALLALVVATLLIIGANVASLFMARAAARSREIAVRTALGASRGRLMRQLVAESMLVAAGGCLVGIVLTPVGMRALAAALAAGPAGTVAMGASSLALDLRLEPRVLAFAILASLVGACVFGLAPAVAGSRTSLAAAMSQRNTAGGSRRAVARQVIISLQIAVSLVLLAGASVFVRTLRNLRDQDLGAAEQARVVMAWTLPSETGLRGDALRAMIASVHARLAGVPGVTRVSESGTGLLGGGSGSIRIWTAASPAAGTRVDGSMTVGPGFFGTIGQRLVAGRDFGASDTDTSSRVVIVNETLARSLFGRLDVIGQRLGDAANAPDEYEIVGVVKDARYRDPRAPAGMVTYWPVLNSGRASRVTFVARAGAGDPRALARDVRRAIREAAPALPVLEVNTVEEQKDRLLFRERMLAGFATFMGVLALVLAGIGLYGVIAYLTAQRASEIAIRLALGSPRSGLLALVLGSSVRFVMVGAVAGVPAAMILRRYAAALTYGVPSVDLAGVGAACGLMAMVAVVAAYLPARRAAAVDPATVLRAD